MLHWNSLASAFWVVLIFPLPVLLRLFHNNAVCIWKGRRLKGFPPLWMALTSYAATSHHDVTSWKQIFTCSTTTGKSFNILMPKILLNNLCTCYIFNKKYVFCFYHCHNFAGEASGNRFQCGKNSFESYCKHLKA